MRTASEQGLGNDWTRKTIIVQKKWIKSIEDLSKINKKTFKENYDLVFEHFFNTYNNGDESLKEKNELKFTVMKRKEYTKRPITDHVKIGKTVFYSMAGLSKLFGVSIQSCQLYVRGKNPKIKGKKFMNRWFVEEKEIKKHLTKINY